MTSGGDSDQQILACPMLSMGQQCLGENCSCMQGLQNQDDCGDDDEEEEDDDEFEDEDEYYNDIQYEND